MKKKGTFSTIILIIVLIIGLSLLLYPTFSDLWNSRFHSRAITSYAEGVSTLNNDEYQQIWQEAVEYNERLYEKPNVYVMTDDEKTDYNSQLDFSGNGAMGYIEIPSINCELPIYHGTDESVLQVAVGHMEWTSLPVGGENTHCVVSGHRGLPSARLFTDLDQLYEGDLFMLHVLNETLTYEVDQILIVEPHETEALLIQEGKDLCTLVTCTPYGINSHRLLIRGHRVENLDESTSVRVVADALQIEPMFVAIILAIPILLVLITILALNDRSNRSKRKKMN